MKKGKGTDLSWGMGVRYQQNRSNNCSEDVGEHGLCCGSSQLPIWISLSAARLYISIHLDVATLDANILPTILERHGVYFFRKPINYAVLSWLVGMMLN